MHFCCKRPASPRRRNANELVAIGTASIILGDALKWKASREFTHRRARLLWVLPGPVGFLLAVRMGYLESFDKRLNTVCTILAAYNFAAAAELSRAGGSPLLSRRPAAFLLVIAGLSYLSWLPLNLVMPIRAAQWVMVSFMVPGHHSPDLAASHRARLHRALHGQGAPRMGAACGSPDRCADRAAQPARSVRGCRCA